MVKKRSHQKTPADQKPCKMWGKLFVCCPIQSRKLTFLEGGLRQEPASSSFRLAMETVKGCEVGVAETPFVATETERGSEVGVDESLPVALTPRPSG